MIYLITYDLKSPGKDYNTLYDTIKSSTSWWHYLDSTWIIQTNQSVDYWSTRIQNVIDQNDLFIIIDITNQSRQGWLPKEAWDWIKVKENM